MTHARWLLSIWRIRRRCRDLPAYSAEGAGFEPAVRVNGLWFSRPAHSTALPPLRWCGDRSRGATVDSVKNMLKMYVRRGPRLSDPTDVYDHTVTLLDGNPLDLN